MIFAEGDAGALTWTVVIASIVSLLANIVQAMYNGRVKQAELTNNVRIALLEQKLEYCEKEHQRVKDRLAKLEGD